LARSGSADNTNSSFLEDIEHAEQFLNEVANDAMNTRMVESIAPNIKELSWKAPWTQFSEIFLEVQKCCKSDGAFKITLPDSLEWRTRPLPKSQVPQAELIRFNIKYKGPFLEIYRETTSAISDGPVIGELPNQGSISDKVEGQPLEEAGLLHRPGC
jgi:hypothetical protein